MSMILIVYITNLFSSIILLETKSKSMLVASTGTGTVLRKHYNFIPLNMQTVMVYPDFGQRFFKLYTDLWFRAPFQPNFSSLAANLHDHFRILLFSCLL